MQQANKNILNQENIPPVRDRPSSTTYRLNAGRKTLDSREQEKGGNTKLEGDIRVKVEEERVNL